MNFSAGSGVFSNGAGQVRVSWDTAHEADQLRPHLTWQEACGPPVKEPRHKGFGSLLIQSTGDAATRIEFRPGGLKCLLERPFSFCARAFLRYGSRILISEVRLSRVRNAPGSRHDSDGPENFR